MIPIQVVGSDGGLRRSPIRFPRAGLFMGVGERYDVVCDLSALAGRSLHLWNVFDDDRMKDVPFFCYSHLVMRINVNAACTGVRGFIRYHFPTCNITNIHLTPDRHLRGVSASP